ncbi:MAG: DUF3343 domain-containing protein [Nitrospirota bacterium]
MDDQYKIFVFKSTYLTFKAERALKNASVVCKVVTKPRDISSDCGLAIRVSATDETAASRIMVDSGITSLGIW